MSRLHLSRSLTGVRHLFYDEHTICQKIGSEQISSFITRKDRCQLSIELLNKNRGCICGTDECKRIYQAFNELGDMRGTFCRSPTINENGRKEDLAKIKKRKRGFSYRICYQNASPPEWKHHGEIVTVDERNLSKNAPCTTGTSEKKKERSFENVSWQHFHRPVQLLSKQTYAFNQNTKSYSPCDTIPAKFAKNVIQAYGLANGYEKSEQCG